MQLDQPQQLKAANFRGAMLADSNLPLPNHQRRWYGKLNKMVYAMECFPRQRSQQENEINPARDAAGESCSNVAQFKLQYQQPA
jgi:hypothetical protein